MEHFTHPCLQACLQIFAHQRQQPNQFYYLTDQPFPYNFTTTTSTQITSCTLQISKNQLFRTTKSAICIFEGSQTQLLYWSKTHNKTRILDINTLFQKDEYHLYQKGYFSSGNDQIQIGNSQNTMNRNNLLDKIEKSTQNIAQYTKTKFKKQKSQQVYPSNKPSDDIYQPQIDEQLQQQHLWKKISNLIINKNLTQLRPFELSFNLIPKISKVFKRQRQNQFKELLALKADILKQYGKVDKGYVWMEIGQNDNQKIDKMARRDSQKRLYHLVNKETNVTQNLVFIEDDYEKLLPGNDLNDTIILSYLKILKNFILPNSVQNNYYFFSTYLLSKLLGDQSGIPEEENIYEHSTEFIQSIKQRISQNYRHVQRWTKKEDIFKKEILIIPINMFAHWFSVIVLNPSQLLVHKPDLPGCQLIFCDSMFTIRDFVIQSIREYLRLELLDKKKKDVVVDSTNSPAIQLLLPRQTNTHDCGLYMLAYIEELLINKHKHLIQLQNIPQRIKLHVFPKMYLHSLRQRMMTFFIKLYQEQKTPESTAGVIQNYLYQRRLIFERGDGGYDTIDMAQFKKFKSLLFSDPASLKDEEEAFTCLIKFNFSQEANFYQIETITQIDNTSDDMQLS